MIRRTVILTCSLAMMATFFGIGATPCLAQDGEQQYTAFNLWYEEPLRMWSTLYMKGALLPAGTPVTNIQVKKKWTKTYIMFINADTGVEHGMLWLATHRPGVTLETFMERLFTSKTRDQLLAGMSATEKKAIAAGQVAKGMSREAVLVCLGYPPETETATLESTVWKFWYDRFRTRTVTFANGKVVSFTQ